MSNACVRSSATLTLFVAALAGCQGHLPALETAPPHASPRTQDVVDHIACEIGIAKNYPLSATTDVSLTKRIAARVANDPRLKDWLGELSQYHFVATAQVSLEVTDTEGLTPSLQYLNNAGSLTIGLGGQLSGTQDRSLTLNYAIDLSDLSTDETRKYCTAFAGASGKAIAGDLGLADIIADGLIALHAAETSNVYGSSGPVPPVLPRSIATHGEIDLPKLDNTGVTPAVHRLPEQIAIELLQGTLQFAPQAPGSSTAGAVSLSGVVSLKDANGAQAKYFAAWTGGILPQIGAGQPVYFSLSGNLTPLPDPAGNPALADRTTKDWGYSPSVTLTGSINSDYALSQLHLAGTLAAASNSLYEKAPPITVQIQPPAAVGGHFSAAATTTAVKGGAASSGGAGGTSFGSLVDFTLVYGLNGGPNWSFARFKGPAAGGSTPLLAATRTRTDSLAITFVATCQNIDSFSKLPPRIANYWQSIGACNPDNRDAQQNGAAVGYQNNSLMILRNFLVK